MTLTNEDQAKITSLFASMVSKGATQVEMAKAANKIGLPCGKGTAWAQPSVSYYLRKRMNVKMGSPESYKKRKHTKRKYSKRAEVRPTITVKTSQELVVDIIESNLPKTTKLHLIEQCL